MVFRVMVLMISGFLCPHLVDGQRAIPDDNLAYPVLITLTNCSSNLTMVQGSGFFLETATELYLVTARHVLFNESERVQPPQAKHVQCKMAELLSYSNDPKDKQQNRIAVNLQALDDARKIKAHATHDVASVQIGIVRAPGTGTLPDRTSQSHRSGQGKFRRFHCRCSAYSERSDTSRSQSRYSQEV